MKLNKICLLLVLFVFLIPVSGLTRNNGVDKEQLKKLQDYKKGHETAKNKRDYLLQHLDDNDDLVIKYNIETIWHQLRFANEPEFLKALERWRQHKDPKISKRAEIIQERVEDLYLYNDFKKALKNAKDKKALLHSYADTDSDRVKQALAHNLADYDDPQSIGILESIAKSKRKRIWAENDEMLIGNPSRIARKILAKIKYKPIGNQLRSSKTSREEKEKLIREYAVSEIPIIKSEIYVFLKDEVAFLPEFAVPLLTEFYSHYFMNEKDIVFKYPELVGQGLDNCMQSSNPSQITDCIKLIKTYKKVQYLQEVFDVVFGEKGSVYYTDINSYRPARHQALYLFSSVGSASLPQLEQLLYTPNKYIGDKLSAIRSIISINDRNSKSILLKYIKSDSPELNKKINANMPFRDEIEQLIAEME
ncbi:MAG: hypothetical protein ABFS18_14235 [Thermodesulfobacteriota bacterium]